MPHAPAPGPLSQARRDDLIDRLRGVYRIPITDGLGPAGGEEPDNPKAFVRRFETPPIHHEAAAALESAHAELARRDALVQAPEVRALVDELRELQQTGHMLATHQVPWQGDPLSLSELARKAADLLASLLEAR